MWQFQLRPLLSFFIFIGVIMLVHGLAAAEDTLGLPLERYEALCEKVKDMRRLEASLYGVDFDENDPDADNPMTDDIILDEDIVMSLTAQMQEELGSENPDPARVKRALYRIGRRWDSTTLSYAFNKTSQVGKKVIRRAIRKFRVRTCLKFNEVSLSDNPDVVFVNSEACASFIGSVARGQHIYLKEPGCINRLGVPLHEIGHALGLFHEHQHPDRELYLTYAKPVLNTAAEMDNYVVNYEPKNRDEVQVMEGFQKYDYQSVMNYPTFGQFTLSTTRKIYQKTVGQRSELSFYDAKVLNQMYCPCRNSGGKPCEEGGYRFWPHCSGKCQCLDGLGGRTCNRPRRHNDEGCFPHRLQTASSSVQFVTSPGFGGQGYQPGSRCSWIIKAPSDDCHIRVWFDRSSFDIPRDGTDACSNWVEVRIRGALYQGQRFCNGDSLNFGSPLNDVMRNCGEGESGYILVTFRSFTNGPNSDKDQRRRGFKMYFQAATCDNGFQGACVN